MAKELTPEQVYEFAMTKAQLDLINSALKFYAWMGPNHLDLSASEIEHTKVLMGWTDTSLDYTFSPQKSCDELNDWTTRAWD